MKNKSLSSKLKSFRLPILKTTFVETMILGGGTVILLTLIFVMYTTNNATAQGERRTSQTQASEVETENVSNVEPKIIGGEHVQPGQWPFVALQWIKKSSNDIESVCSGSVIHPNWVLSAAHCVEKDFRLKGPGEYYFITYNNHIRDSSNHVVNVVETIKHDIYENPTEERGIEKYLQQRAHDLVLFRLETPIEDIEPIHLQTDYSIPVESGTYVKAIGWGYTEEKNSQSITDILKQIDIMIIDRQRLRENFPRYPMSQYSDSLYFAMSYEGSPYAGDSGGPWLVENPDPNITKHYLAGVTSSGVIMNKVYLVNGPKILNNIDWIEKTLARYGDTIPKSNPNEGNEQTEEPTQTSQTTDTSPKTCPAGFDQAYWDAETNPQDPKCVCINTVSSEYKELREQYGGGDVTPEECNSQQVIQLSEKEPTSDTGNTSQCEDPRVENNCGDLQWRGCYCDTTVGTYWNSCGPEGGETYYDSGVSCL